MSKITLEIPPSTNATYRHSGHFVYMLPAARVWKNKATLQLREFRGVEPTTVTIRYYLKRERDVDGSHKIILDAMQGAEVVVNDSTITELHLYKEMDKKNPRVELFF